MPLLLYIYKCRYAICQKKRWDIREQTTAMARCRGLEVTHLPVSCLITGVWSRASGQPAGWGNRAALGSSSLLTSLEVFCCINWEHGFRSNTCCISILLSALECTSHYSWSRMLVVYWPFACFSFVGYIFFCPSRFFLLVGINILQMDCHIYRKYFLWFVL